LVKSAGEVAAPVLPQNHRLAVDQRLVHRQTANSLGDRREPIGEVSASAAPDLHPLTLLAGKDAEAIVLHLVQPAQAGWREGDEGRPTGFDETGRQRKVARSGHRQMPRHVYVCKAACLPELAAYEKLKLEIKQDEEARQRALDPYR
jgi:hypothetical protein